MSGRACPSANRFTDDNHRHFKLLMETMLGTLSHLHKGPRMRIRITSTMPCNAVDSTRSAVSADAYSAVASQVPPDVVALNQRFPMRSFRDATGRIAKENNIRVE